MNHLSTSTVLAGAFKVIVGIALLPAFLLIQATQVAYADSATWNLNPVTNDWSTAANWMPNIVPNDPTDIATFAVSHLPSPTLSEAIELSEIVFDPNASAYTIRFRGGPSLDLYGAGVTNNSGILQKFNLHLVRDVSSQIVFHNSATAGDDVLYQVESPNPPAGLMFLDSSSAGSSVILNSSSVGHGLGGGKIEFSDNSTAAEATIINYGGDFDGAEGAITDFVGSATAGHATIVAHSSRGIGAAPAYITFQTGTHAGDVTLITETPGVTGSGAGIIFYAGSTADRARIILHGGYVNLNFIDTSSFSIGSIEGPWYSDLAMLTLDLTIGTNNRDSSFAGSIDGSGEATLRKVGKGTLTLSGYNTYGGLTTVEEGALLVHGPSGRIEGNVQVNGGTLGGTGTLFYDVNIGDGTGRPAVLAPGQEKSIGTLTIYEHLTFNSDAVYNFGIDSDQGTAGQVKADIVDINGGTFSPLDRGSTTLSPGTTFIVINSTGPSGILGNFNNLPDRSMITIGNNTYHVDYEGGDGNDLTLTVIE